MSDNLYAELARVVMKTARETGTPAEKVLDRHIDLLAYADNYAAEHNITLSEALAALSQPEEMAIMHQELKEKWDKEAADHEQAIS